MPHRTKEQIVIQLPCDTWGCLGCGQGAGAATPGGRDLRRRTRSGHWAFPSKCSSCCAVSGCMQGSRRRPSLVPLRPAVAGGAAPAGGGRATCPTSLSRVSQVRFAMSAALSQIRVFDLLMAVRATGLRALSASLALAWLPLSFWPRLPRPPAQALRKITWRWHAGLAGFGSPNASVSRSESQSVDMVAVACCR